MGFSGPLDDQLAIRALIDSYSDAVFRRDAADWGANWAADARWHLMGQEVVGREAIVALWTQAMSGFAFVAFFAQVGALAVDGELASGTVWTHEVLEAADGSLSRPVGRYDDRYIKNGERWLFAERRYTMLKG